MHGVAGALQVRYEVGAPLGRALLRLLAPLGHVALQGRVDSQAHCRAPQRDRPIYLATCLDVIPIYALGLGLALLLVLVLALVLLLIIILALVLVG